MSKFINKWAVAGIAVVSLSSVAAVAAQSRAVRAAPAPASTSFDPYGLTGEMPAVASAARPGGRPAPIAVRSAGRPAIIVPPPRR